MTDDPHIPTVTLVIELEATPRLAFDAATFADRPALRTWVRETRPDLYDLLCNIADEIQAKKEAA